MKLFGYLLMFCLADVISASPRVPLEGIRQLFAAVEREEWELDIPTQGVCLVH